MLENENKEESAIAEKAWPTQNLRIDLGEKAESGNVNEQGDLKVDKGLSNKSIIAVVVAIIIIAVIAVIFGQKHKFEPITAGGIAPDFSLPDSKGNILKLSDYRGKVVFVNFWATWCKPCEEEIPSMQVMYDTLKRDYNNFELLAISIDTSEISEVIAFTNKYEVTFPILHDKRGQVKENYKTTGVPETFIIDQNGIIAEKVLGQRNWHNQESITTILNLLTNGPSTPDKYKSR